MTKEKIINPYKNLETFMKKNNYKNMVPIIIVKKISRSFKQKKEK